MRPRRKRSWWRCFRGSRWGLGRSLGPRFRASVGLLEPPTHAGGTRRPERSTEVGGHVAAGPVEGSGVARHCELARHCERARVANVCVCRDTFPFFAALACETYRWGKPMPPNARNIGVRCEGVATRTGVCRRRRAERRPLNSPRTTRWRARRPRPRPTTPTASASSASR